MLGYGKAFYELKDKLQPSYDEREAVAIAHEVVGHITGLGKTQRLNQKEVAFTEEQQREYDRMSRELQTGKPMQYVLSTAWFMGREFFVNEHVLIPRPETEELVDWVLKEVESQKSNIESAGEGVLKILDIGTGSGCIPISLKLALPEAEVTSCDISKEAIAVAQRNARNLGASVEFVQMDFLDRDQHNKLGTYDVIVSNPPYIPAEEKARLHRNVADFEPGIALFVPDDDALVFYKAIAVFAREHRTPGGSIFCELDAAHYGECRNLFDYEGYSNLEIKKGYAGKLEDAERV